MQKLKSMIEAELNKTGEVIHSYPWNDPIAYGMWLAQTFQFVNHSTRLLTLAGACAPLNRQSFHNRIVAHSQEERGHEKMAFMNLKALGFSPEDFPTLTQTHCLYQIQYHWIQHRNPVSIYGYILALETLAETHGPYIAEQATKAHGPKAATFIRVHAEDDIDHTQSTFDEIEAFTEVECDLICENLAVSGPLYRQMLVEAKAQSTHYKVKNQKAA